MGRETGTAGAIVQVPSPTASECANPSASSRGAGSIEADGVGEADEVEEGAAVGEAAWLSAAASAAAGDG